MLYSYYYLVVGNVILLTIELIYGRSYVFTIRDSFGDGMSKVCPAGYSLSITATKNTLFSGDGFSFVSMKSYPFSINLPSPTPSHEPSLTTSPTSVASSTSPSNEPSTIPAITPTGALSFQPSLSSLPSSSPSMSPSITESLSLSSSPSLNKFTSPSLLSLAVPSNYSLRPSIKPSKPLSTSPTEMKSSSPTPHPSLLRTLSPPHKPSFYPSDHPFISPPFPSYIPSQPPSMYNEENPYTLILRFDKKPQDIFRKLVQSFPQVGPANMYGEPFGHYTKPCDCVETQLYLLEELTSTFSIYDKNGNGMNDKCNVGMDTNSKHGYSLYEGSIGNLASLVLEGDRHSFTYVKQETFVEGSNNVKRSSVPSEIPIHISSAFPITFEFPANTNSPSSLPSAEALNLPSGVISYY